jgi:uncharacterized protein YndB with AHSA1/START domain
LSHISKVDFTALFVREENMTYQPDPDVIRWKIHFHSPVHAVYNALTTSEGRRRFWAESAEETDTVIHFIVPGKLESKGRILERLPGKRFVTEYFGWTVAFDLEPDSAGSGTDLQMTCTSFPPADRTEIIAGWVSVLMTMKAAVDFDVDLRNHDPDRSWWDGYADN